MQVCVRARLTSTHLAFFVCRLIRESVLTLTIGITISSATRKLLKNNVGAIETRATEGNYYASVSFELHVQPHPLGHLVHLDLV